MICCFSQHPAHSNEHGNVALDIEDVRQEALNLFEAVASHVRFLACKNNFKRTTPVNEKCYLMMVDSVHCYQFLSQGQNSWISEDGRTVAPFYR